MVDLPRKSYAKSEERTAFYKQVLDRLSHLPGVEHAAAVSDVAAIGRSVDRYDPYSRRHKACHANAYRALSLGHSGIL